MSDMSYGGNWTWPRSVKASLRERSQKFRRVWTIVNAVRIILLYHTCSRSPIYTGIYLPDCCDRTEHQQELQHIVAKCKAEQEELRRRTTMNESETVARAREELRAELTKVNVSQ